MELVWIILIGAVIGYFGSIWLQLVILALFAIIYFRGRKEDNDMGLISKVLFAGAFFSLLIGDVVYYAIQLIGGCNLHLSELLGSSIVNVIKMLVR